MFFANARPTAAATLIAYLEHQNMTVPPVPPRLNYKAYWGDAPTITLVHWHGKLPLLPATARAHNQ